MAKNPFVSILIPAYNEEKCIGKTLDSIHHSFSSIETVTYEVIVCDNHSSDRTAEIAQSKGAKVVTEPHQQIARARNTAAKAAKGECFIFLDADTLLNPIVLKETLKAFQSRRVLAGGSIIRTDMANPTLFVRTTVWLWTQVSIYFKLAAGSYLFCHRDAWNAVGGFDEKLYVSEEIGFSNQLKKWCRANDAKFEIITKGAITTSSRKVHWYTPTHMLKEMFKLLLIPGAMSKRENCSFWYVRPD